MSKAESRLIDSMIEVSIIGIREKPSLFNSLKKSKPEESERNDSFGSIFERHFTLLRSKTLLVEKDGYRDLGEHI